MKTKILAFVALISFSVSSFLDAEIYYRHIETLDQTCSNFGVPAEQLGNSEVPVDYMDLSYDDVQEILTIEVKVHRDATSGKLADIFHFAVSEGAMPEGEGSVAHFYFDASGSTPKATVYAYNGRGMPEDDDSNMTNNSLCGNAKPVFYVSPGVYYGAGSWSQANLTNSPIVAPDAFYNSTSNPAYFLELTKTEVATDTFIYKLVFDASDLNAEEAVMFYDAFCPPPVTDNLCRSYVYKGARFGDNMGIWFWAAADASMTYYPNGWEYEYYDDYDAPMPNVIETRSAENFISNFNTNAATCAICDQADFETKRAPRCDGVTLSSAQVVVGKEVTISFIANDPDHNDTEEVVPVSVSYTGAPAGARLDPEEGAEITNFDDKGVGSADVIWVPVLNQLGEHTISAAFAKDYGLDGLESLPGDCQINLRVFANCDPIDPSGINEADNNALRIKDISIDLDSRTKKYINRVRKIEGEDPIDFNGPLDGINTTALWQSSWGIFNSIVAKDQGTYSNIECIQGCSEEVNSFSISAQVSTFTSQIAELNEVTINRIPDFRTAYRQFLVKKKGLKPRRAKKRARAEAERYREGTDMINVNFESANDQINNYVAIYGTERVKCGA